MPLSTGLKSRRAQLVWKQELTGCQDEWARVGVEGVGIVSEFHGRKVLNSSSVCNSEAAEMLEGRGMILSDEP